MYLSQSFVSIKQSPAPRAQIKVPLIVSKNLDCIMYE